MIDNAAMDIAVLDPTFNSGTQYLDILKRFAERGYTGKLSLQCRLEMVKPEFLDLVQDINRSGRVVLEFGLQTIHREEMRVIQRLNNMRKINRILPDIQRRSIETEISLIFGLPMQTVGSFQESIDFCKEQGVETIHAFPLMLLRGTLLYDQKQKLGLVESTDKVFPKIPRIQENIPHVVSSPSFTFSDWLQMGEMSEALEQHKGGM